jgi:hypothetical protein
MKPQQKIGRRSFLQLFHGGFQAGRAVTAQILDLSQPAKFRAKENQELLVQACSSFIRMYRPHESREDTVLFPALRIILTAKAVQDLGDRMEEDEKKVLGDEGFEKSVAPSPRAVCRQT